MTTLSPPPASWEIAFAIVLALAWLVAVWMQPLERVVEALQAEYALSPPPIQHLVGPLEPGLGHLQGVPRGPRALATRAANAERTMAVCMRLLAVRLLTFGVVYLAGVPLLIATWQVGKAQQRAGVQRGIPPHPTWQSAGWMLAALGLVVPSVGLGPFAVAAALSFGWLGAAGSAVSASGAYLLGRHSRRG